MGNSMNAAAAIVASRAAGQLAGAAVYSFFLDLVDPLVVMCGACFGTALCTVVVLPSRSLLLLLGTMAHQGFFIGILDSACTQEIVTYRQEASPAASVKALTFSRWKLAMQIAMAGGAALVGVCLLMLL